LPADQADGERHHPRHDGDDEPGLEQPLPRIDPDYGVDGEPEERSSEVVRRKSLPLMIPMLTDVTTTMRNISLGPRSMVPMTERPASGVRYSLKCSSVKNRASAVKSIVSEAARAIRIAVFVLRMRLPEALQEVPGDAELYADDEPHPEQHRPGVRVRVEQQGFDALQVAALDEALRHVPLYRRA
jgi:hypothetical protein